MPGTAATTLAIAVLAAIGVGYAGADREERRAGEVRAAGAPEKWKPGATRARRYAEGRLGEASFAIRTGPVVRRHRARDVFETRSVIKVMLMAAYMRSRDVRDRELSGEEKSLLRPMIRFSNNRAANELTTRLEPGELHGLARAARMRDFHYELPYWGNSTTTAIDQAGLMHRLARLVPARHVGYARHLLRTITDRQRWGVADAKPRGWKLHFKSGWGSRTGEQEHQVALLARHGCRVSLAIFTRGSPSAAYARETQRAIARRLLAGLKRDSC